MALKDLVPGPPNLHHKQVRDLADAIEAELTGLNTSLEGLIGNYPQAYVAEPDGTLADATRAISEIIARLVAAQIILEAPFTPIVYASFFAEDT